MKDDRLERLRIASHQKRRSGLPTLLIIGGVLVVTGVIAWWAVPRASDDVRAGMKSGPKAIRTEAGIPLEKAGADRLALRTLMRIFIIGFVLCLLGYHTFTLK